VAAFDWLWLGSSGSLLCQGNKPLDSIKPEKLFIIFSRNTVELMFVIYKFNLMAVT
jgi:hypothetical protein